MSKYSVGLDKNGGFSSETLLQFQIVADIAQVFLDLSDSFKVSGAIESVASEQEQFDEVARNITSSNV